MFQLNQCHGFKLDVLAAIIIFGPTSKASRISRTVLKQLLDTIIMFVLILENSLE
jgi:hypothetical protein